MQGRITKVTMNDDGSPMICFQTIHPLFPPFPFYITFPSQKGAEYEPNGNLVND
jgi:hypothetical protein